MERCELYKTNHSDSTYYLVIDTDPTIAMTKCTQEMDLYNNANSIPIPLSNGKILWTEEFINDLNGSNLNLIENCDLVEKIDDYYCDLLNNLKCCPCSEETRKEILELQKFGKQSYASDDILYRTKSDVKKSFDTLCNFRSSWLLSKKRTMKSCGFRTMKQASLYYKKVNIEIAKRVEIKIKNDLIEASSITCTPCITDIFQIPETSWSLENKVELLINCYYYTIDEVNKLYKTNKITKEYILNIANQVKCS